MILFQQPNGQWAFLDTIGSGTDSSNLAVLRVGGVADPSDITDVKVAFSANNSTPIAAVGGQTIKVYSMLFASSAAASVSIRSGASTVLSGPMPILASNPIVLPYTGVPWFTTPSGGDLNILLSTSAAAGGSIQYIQG